MPNETPVSQSDTTSTVRPWLLGRGGALCCLALALLIFSSSVIGVVPEFTIGAELTPEPDSPEYFGAAVSLSRGEGYRLHIAGESHPPRYPPGYSLLMVPLLKLGVEPIKVPFMVNRLAGIALIMLLFFWLWHRGHPGSAGLAVLLLVTLPAFIILSRSAMSEMTSTVLITAGFLTLYSAYAGGSPVLAALGGLLLGLSIGVRTSNALFAIVLPTAIILSNRNQRFPAFIRSAAACAGYAAGVIPTLWYNAEAFGSIFQTGYSYWIPFWTAPTKLLNAKYLAANISYYMGELLQRQPTTTTASFFGEGTYFGPAFVALATASFVTLWNHRRIRIFSLVGIAMFATYLFYFFQDGRLVFPLLVLSIPLIAVASVENFSRIGAVRLKVMLAILLILQLAIFPSRKGDANFDRYVRSKRLTVTPYVYQLVGHFNSIRPRGEVLVLTNISQPYVYGLTAEGTTVAPLNGDHEYRFSPSMFNFSDQDVERLIGEAQDARKPIFVIARPRSRPDSPQPEALLPRAPDEFEWALLFRGGQNEAIFQLGTAGASMDGGTRSQPQ